MTTFVPAVYIVKSCMPATFDTPEQWRDLSIALKSIGDENYQILSENKMNKLVEGCIKFILKYLKEKKLLNLN